MRILIVGGAGFIGLHTAEYLVLQGHDVRLLDCNGEMLPLEWRERFQLFDLTTGEIPVEELEWAEYVLYFAHTTLPQTSNTRMQFDISSNVVNLVAFLEECTKRNIKKIIYSSSGGTVYGGHSGSEISEAEREYPLCSYGITKMMAERYLHLFRHLYGLDYCVLRIANPYGPKQNITRGQGAVNTFLYKILSKQPITIWGDGSVIRDYLYVEDVAHAVMLAIEGPKEKTPVYNIGSGQGHSLLEIIQSIQECVGHPATIEFQKARPVDVQCNILNTKFAYQSLKWKPTIDLPEGIRRTALWMKKTYNF